MSKQNEIKKRTLDFSECSYIGEIYLTIKNELELPDWCGNNLDALWDAITGIMYTPAEITIKRIAKRKELQNSIDEIISVFCEAEEEYHEITVLIDQTYLV